METKSPAAMEKIGMGVPFSSKFMMDGGSTSGMVIDRHRSAAEWELRDSMIQGDTSSGRSGEMMPALSIKSDAMSMYKLNSFPCTAYPNVVSSKASRPTPKDDKHQGMK